MSEISDKKRRETINLVAYGVDDLIDTWRGKDLDLYTVFLSALTVIFTRVLLESPSDEAFKEILDSAEKVARITIQENDLKESESL